MGRLFWKFFFFIWLAQLSAMLGIGGTLWLKDQTEQSWRKTLDTSPPTHAWLESASLTLRHGGSLALRDLLSDAGIHAPLAVDDRNHDILGRAIDPDLLAQARRFQNSNTPHNPVRHAQAPDGSHFLFFSPRVPTGGTALRPPPPPAHFDEHGVDGTHNPNEPHFLPLIPLATALLASLIFAAVLAWYFARPIRTLKAAFEAVTSGNLALRITPEMGHRRDELADLGRDFDRMVTQLQTLVDGQRRLLHDVSHEMRSPLARLQVAIGLARQRPERIASSMDRIDRECVRMDKLIGELLTLSRLEAGIHSGWEESVAIGQLLEELLEDAQFEASASGRNVDAGPCEDVTIPGQPELLHRALENVIRNAIRHSPERGHIEVDSWINHGQNTLQITIQDTGSGIAESDLQTIFEPFNRGSQTGGDGYGLGLTIARRIVEMHKGNIQASNRATGGLRVTIELPLSHG